MMHRFLSYLKSDHFYYLRFLGVNLFLYTIHRISWLHIAQLLLAALFFVLLLTSQHRILLGREGVDIKLFVRVGAGVSVVFLEKFVRHTILLGWPTVYPQLASALDYLPYAIIGVLALIYYILEKREQRHLPTNI